MSTTYRLVLTTCDCLQNARKIASQLVELKLAACVNILPEIESVYTWQGSVAHDKEVKLLIKTREDKVEHVVEKLSYLHTYDVPEIQVLEVKGGSEAYFNWMDEVLS